MGQSTKQIRTMPLGIWLALRSYKKDSCDVDTCLFVAMILRLGRVQGDQISFEITSKLPAPAFMLRTLACFPWGTLATKERSGLRVMVAVFKGLSMVGEFKSSSISFGVQEFE